MRKSVFRSISSRKILEEKYNSGASVQELMKIFDCSDFPIYSELRRGAVTYVGKRPVYSAQKAQDAYEKSVMMFAAARLE